MLLMPVAVLPHVERCGTDTEEQGHPGQPGDAEAPATDVLGRGVLEVAEDPLYVGPPVVAEGVLLRAPVELLPDLALPVLLEFDGGLRAARRCRRRRRRRGDQRQGAPDGFFPRARTQRAAHRAGHGGTLEPAPVHDRDRTRRVHAALIDECGQRLLLPEGAVGPRWQDRAESVRSAGTVQPAGRQPGTVVVPEPLVVPVQVNVLLDTAARQLLGPPVGSGTSRWANSPGASNTTARIFGSVLTGHPARPEPPHPRCPQHDSSDWGEAPLADE